jgi:type III secretion system-like peptide-binding chaperone
MPEHEWRRFLTNLMQCFLDCAIESQFVILENAGTGDEFVQFKMNHRILYAEVGSREWDVADRRRPLDPEARDLLAALGFTHGGPERNYICDNLAQSAPYLADLILRLNVAAYGSVPANLNVKSDVVAVRALAGPLANVPKPSAYFWQWSQHKALRSTPVKAPPGLKFRVERALRSNFAEIGSTTEELESLRHEVEKAGSFEALPEWAQDWIRKAEEGPLWVVLGH